MPFRLLKNELLADGLRRIAKEQIDRALSDFDDAALSERRKVHSLRARCKKLRGLLRMVEPLMGDAFEPEDLRFRDAARALAGHREQDVLAKSVDSLDSPTDWAPVPRTAIKPDAIATALGLMAECRSAVDDWPLPVQGFADLAPGFSRTYRKCRRAFETVLDAPDDAHFHRLRKWGKYHWYHVRILHRLNRKKIGRQRERLRKLQLTLGDAHDLAMLQETVASRGNPAAVLPERAMERKLALYARARKSCFRAYARSADEWVADYARWWVDWTR